MNRDALVTALAALALAGCATTRVGGAPAADPLVVANHLPAVAEPVRREAPPPFEPVMAPPGDPMTAALLRARLVAFVLEAEVTRGSVPMGAPMPESQREAWKGAETDVDRFLAAPPGEAEGEDVRVARGSLRAALDRDGQVYGGLPPELVAAVEERLGQLDTRSGVLPGARFQWPLDKITVTSRFGRRYHPIAHREKMHRGIDLAAEKNAPVVAAGQGIVVRAGWMQGYGYEVTVDHGDGRMTRYSHLARTLVLEGTQVVKGMPLGLAGRTGTATGVHLHFEYWKNDVALDPLREFAKLVGEGGPKPVVVVHPARKVKPTARKPEGPGA